VSEERRWQEERQWLERLPKLELHLHLEGAIPHEALWELIDKYGGDPQVPTRSHLSERFRYRDFAHFIETWVWKNRFLREQEDFSFLAEAVARDLARQRVIYAEVFFSPADFARHGLGPQSLAEAIRSGLSRVPDIEVALIADLVRDLGPAQAARTLAEVAEVRTSARIIGIGLGGSEAEHPPELFAEAFKTARDLGFHTTAHAGEAAGSASVWGAIQSLGVERIGHATRAIEDDALVDYLAEHQVPVELCPISNLRTGVIPDLAHHPVQRYLEHGLLVSINSDDPTMFGTSLVEEYLQLEQQLGLSRDDVRRLLLLAVASSWLEGDRKREVAAALQGDQAWSG
jgi:adenosine deaminase